MITTRKQFNAIFREIILVDDDDIFNMLNKRILKFVGFENRFSIFQNGRLAKDYILDCIDQYLVKQEASFTLILLDLNMPTMDGWGFLEWFRKLDEPWKEKYRIIILTSSCHNADIKKAMSYEEVAHFISKPLTSASISEALDALMG